MQRLYPDNVGRLLHSAIYNRMVSFGDNYAPEIPSEPFVENCLNAFYLRDDRIQIFYDVNGNSIVAHGVITIEDNYGVIVVNGRQVQDDRKNGVFVDEFMEYLSKLRVEVGAHCSICSVSKNVKVFEKKYSYTAVRTIVVQSSNMEEE